MDQTALKTQVGDLVDVLAFLTTLMSAGLLAQQLETYHRDGFISPIRVLSAEETQAVTRALDGVVTRCGAPRQRVPSLHSYFAWAYDLATHPRILDAVENIIGPNIVVWGTLVLSKAAQTRFMVPWHQDGAYAAYLKGAPAVTAWVALSPVTAENGCMRFIPGSHGSILPFTDVLEPDSMIKRGQRITAPLDESKAIDIELAPGEASLHEVTLVHASNANRSNIARTGFIIRYTTPAILQPMFPIYYVRGHAGDLRCAVPPPGDDPDAYIEYLRTELTKSL